MSNLEQMASKAKKLAVLAIPGLIIIAFVGGIIYIGYRAETELRYLKGPKLYLKGREEAPGRIGTDASSKSTSGISFLAHKTPVSGTPAVRLDAQESAPISSSHVFSDFKDIFVPSTMGFIETKKLKIDERTKRPHELEGGKEMLLKLSGSLAEEMFVIAIYNSMGRGKLIRDGIFRLKPRGKRSGEAMEVEFIFLPEEKMTAVQLPIILNGQVNPVFYKDAGIFIDKYGRLTSKGTIANPLNISYTITRLTENSGLSVKLPVSNWLKIEFREIPPAIKNYLNTANGGPDDYKMIFVCAIFNRCFGYQRGIIPVKLAEGMTWGSYLQKSLSRNSRFLCDCDVLSTYAFIFMRYLGLKAVVAVGYDNSQPEKIDTLSSDELHATVLVKLDSEWILFDPTFYTPDMSGAALRLSAGRQLDEKNTSGMRVRGTGSDSRAYKTTGLSAKSFTIPSKVVNLLGGAIFSQRQRRHAAPHSKRVDMDFSSLNLDRKEMLSLYRDRSLLEEWTGIVILIAMVAFSLSYFINTSVSFFIKMRGGTTKLTAPLPVWHFALGKLFMLVSWWYLIGRAIGLRINHWPTPNWSLLIGALLTTAGAGLNIVAHFESTRRDITGSDSYEIWLKSNGLHRLSRNPEYTGYFAILLGACFYSPGWPVILFSFSAIIIHHLCVNIKERFLLDTLKNTWLSYSDKVPKYL